MLAARVSVSVECPEELKLLQLRRSVDRGPMMYVFNFHTVRFQETDLMTFFIGREPSESWKKTTKLTGEIIETAFPDFCWKAGSGSNETNMMEITTPMDKEILGDLAEVFSAAFVEDLIETTIALNDGVLSGEMQNASIRGPYRGKFIDGIV